jgi:hypothetical protein
MIEECEDFFTYCTLKVDNFKSSLDPFGEIIIMKSLE